MIIDIHSHLGDILYPNGGDLIGRTGIDRYSELDVISIVEQGLFRLPEEPDNESGDDEIAEIVEMVAEASRARNFTATLENMRKSMDEAGVTKTVCLPVPPYVFFDDLKKAQQIDSGIIPFTGVDYTREYDIESSLSDDVARGAKGMKLHPVIQKIPLNSKRTFEAVEVFAPHGLPVLFHCGVSSLYLGNEKEKNQIMQYGEIYYARELVSAFPSVTFIAGHAGLFEVEEVMQLLGGFKNVSVDITFHSPETIIDLISVFGPERILYASDWPFGDRKTMIKTVQEACNGDKALESLIFCENAARLLQITD